MSTCKDQQSFRRPSGERKDSDQSREVVDEVLALKEQLAEIRSFDMSLREKHASCGLTDSEVAYFILQREVESRLDYLGDTRPVQSFIESIGDGAQTDKEPSNMNTKKQRIVDIALRQSGESSEVRNLPPYPEVFEGGHEEVILEIHRSFYSNKKNMRFGRIF